MNVYEYAYLNEFIISFYVVSYALESQGSDGVLRSSFETMRIGRHRQSSWVAMGSEYGGSTIEPLDN